jgi:hypothetical protein
VDDLIDVVVCARDSAETVGKGTWCPGVSKHNLFRVGVLKRLPSPHATDLQLLYWSGTQSSNRTLEPLQPRQLGGLRWRDWLLRG